MVIKNNTGLGRFSAGFTFQTHKPHPFFILCMGSAWTLPANASNVYCVYKHSLLTFDANVG